MSAPTSTTPWLAIIGLHEDGLAGLGDAARAWIGCAGTVVGDARTLAHVPPEHPAERLLWPQPLTAILPELARRRGQPAVVLASGDPLFHGVGAMLANAFPPGEWVILPQPTSCALACARLGWPHAEVGMVSLHHRPVEILVNHLLPGARLVVLVRDGGTPAAIAALLVARGWGASRLTVFERLGSPQEGRRSGTAAAWPYPRTDDLNVVAIACVPGPGAVVPGFACGLPDELFASDGVMTKREARALALSALAPVPGQTLWDVGAGCGSVGIEWLRALGARGRVFAVERSPERRALISANCERFGADRLQIVAGEAPAALAGLPRPDAIFLGGGVSAPGVVVACWEALAPGGRLVASAVSLEGEAVLLEGHGRLGGDLLRLAVARAAPLGALTGWRPQMPLTQWSVRKES